MPTARGLTKPCEESQPGWWGQAAEELGSGQRELMTLPRCQPLGNCFSPAHCFSLAPELLLEPVANE